ncbi:MAG: hypothetical protein AB7T37_03495 [Dehalococcoidia bacterium]
MAAINLPRPPLPFPGVRLNWWIVWGVVVLGVGGTLPVLQSSAATSRGFEIRDLEAEQAQLRTDISLLEGDVARLTSLERVERRARDLGLEQSIEPPLFVTVDTPGPSPARIPSEYLPSNAAAKPVAEPWWRDVLSWLSIGD